MAQGKYRPIPPTHPGAEKKIPGSTSCASRNFILAGAAAALIMSVGIGIWQHHFFEKPSGTSMPATETRCDVPNGVVVVRSPDPDDALTACEGSRDAIMFLPSQGLDVPVDVTIELLAAMPAEASASAAGYYLESERKALILVYSQFRKFKSWFGIPIDRSLYRSLASHEVAHSVAAYNFKIPKPSIQAKEYIAYVTQLSTMEPVMRARVLAQFPSKAFEDDGQMNPTIYLFDSSCFGVRAYRHFLKPANGRNYLHAILAGKALAE